MTFARSGRNAAGLVSASRRDRWPPPWRWPAPPRADPHRTACWRGCSAPSRGRAGTRPGWFRRAAGRWWRPRWRWPAPPPADPDRTGKPARLFSDPARFGQEGLGVGLGQPPVGGDGLVGGGQRVLPPTHVGLDVGEVVQRPREIRQEGVGVGLGQPPVSGDGLVGGGQRVLPPTHVAIAMLARLFSDHARSGRNASGLVSASRRRRWPPRSAVASASSRRPTRRLRVGEVVQRRREVG